MQVAIIQFKFTVLRKILQALFMKKRDKILNKISSPAAGPVRGWRVSKIYFLIQLSPGMMQPMYKLLRVQGRQGFLVNAALIVSRSRTSSLPKPKTSL
jgi:hypothetical protein